MSKTHTKQNRKLYYNKYKLRESFEKIPAFVIVCNADGPIREVDYL